MRETEFTDALGRLLTDGRLRDDFAVNPDGVIASLCENALTRAQLLSLKFEELEAQAEVLLGKRFDLIKRILPTLVCRLETKAWPLFRQYARNCWQPAPQDALGFAEFARGENASQIDARELNRLRFATQSRAPFKVHRIESTLQLLVRLPRNRWREFAFWFRL